MSTSYLITGANRGLGLEFASQLSRAGARVIATTRDPKSATELAALDVQVEELDVSAPSSVAALAKRLDGEQLDVLVNNAGIGVRSQPFEKVDLEEMQHFFSVNSIGPLRVTQALLPNLRRGSKKRIVNITSKMGSIADNQSGAAYAYRASKTALNMATKSLALDLGSEGFVCAVLHPGWVATDMGGSGAPVQPEESVAGMLRVMETLDEAKNGGFFDYTGEAVPW